MCKAFGYVRVSTNKQKADRQRANILDAYPEALLMEDKYTGTKIAGRVQFEKLLKLVKAGDTIVFDKVSRMSRNAAEGIDLYKQLMARGVELVFIKEPHINTQTYKQQLKGLADRKTESSGDADANKLISGIMGAVNEYMIQYIGTLKTAQDDAQTPEEARNPMAYKRVTVYIGDDATGKSTTLKS